MSKKILALFLISFGAQAAIFSDAELSAHLQTPVHHCGKYGDYMGGTPFTSNATLTYLWPSGYVTGSTSLSNVQVGWSPTTNLSNFTLANGTVVRRSIGNGAITIKKGINIYDPANVLSVHIPVNTYWGTPTSNYRLSNGQVQVFDSDTGLPNGVTMQYIGYYFNDYIRGQLGDWLNYGILVVNKAGKSYRFYCANFL